MVIELAFSVTPLPLALSTARPRSCEPSESAAKRRPGRGWQSTSPPGGPPLAYVGAVVASITTFWLMDGSQLASVMMPWTVKWMAVDLVDSPASARTIAARSEPGPESARLVTVMIRQDGETAVGTTAWLGTAAPAAEGGAGR